jgi:hypothetical protein
VDATYEGAALVFQLPRGGIVAAAMMLAVFCCGTGLALAQAVPPPAAPSPAPTNEAFISGDYVISQQVYNELSPGNAATSAYRLRAAAELGSSVKVLLAVRFGHDQYAHNANQVSLPCAVGTLHLHRVRSARWSCTDADHAEIERGSNQRVTATLLRRSSARTRFRSDL